MRARGTSYLTEALLRCPSPVPSDIRRRPSNRNKAAGSGQAKPTAETVHRLQTGPPRPPPSMAPLAVVAAALLLLLSGHPAQARAPTQHFAVKVGAAAGGKVDAASLCSNTDYPDLCVSAARGIRGSASEKALIAASIQAAIKKIQAAKARAASIVKAVSKGNRAESEIQTCQEVYDSALADLQSSMKALQRGSITDLKELLSSAMADVDTCDEGYDEAGEKSPLAVPDGETDKLASNALALAQASTKKGR
ncbi:hypothetical protein Taro_018043 [Colocasia esculenta]|uniref:Pectinesterase inhibitor domain-containing protein n=1 Tax=Colocasia esculenta TaxID=4460 RepID=A0A843UHQ5_COLES|nr:hypothetical protein [Colocasia esculenta]